AIYPERDYLFSKSRRSSYLIAALLYLPATLLILAEAWVRTARLRALLPLSAVNIRALLSNIEITLFAISMAVSTGLLIRSFRQARTVIVRQQLKWVMWG